jgi:hypothetical protein
MMPKAGFEPALAVLKKGKQHYRYHQVKYLRLDTNIFCYHSAWHGKYVFPTGLVPYQDDLSLGE